MNHSHGESDVPAVLCRELTRELGSTVKTRVLNAVDLTITSGQFVAITGHSGSGKSTLLYLLGALDRPSSGLVQLFGRDISALDDDARAELRSLELGFVFQFHFLLPEFTVLENVTIPMVRSGKFDSSRAQARAREVLGELGLGELWARKPNQLSGGQQQRVSIARAIAHGPRLLLADEPTGNLDSANGEAVMTIFERLVRERGLTVAMVTHEPSFAARATRQLVMRDGKIVEDHDQTRR